MAQKDKCSICGQSCKVYKCSNEICNKVVCLDCANDYTMPIAEYFLTMGSKPILKCPSCGYDLIINEVDIPW